MNKKIQAFFIILAVAIAAGMAGFLYSRQSPLKIEVAEAEPQTDVTSTHRASYMNADFYDAFYPYEPVIAAPQEQVFSGIIPHHLVAGSHMATFFQALTNQKPEVVVLIGPNHPQAGRNNFVTSLYNWRTPYGTLKANKEIVEKLMNNPTSPTALSSAEARDIAASSPSQRRGKGEVSLVVDEKIMDKEFSIGNDVAFIKKTWPNTTFVPIILKERATTEQIQALATKLKEILPQKSLILASVDFSHYLPEYISNFHDELSQNVLATGDVSRISKMEIDSRPSVRLLLEYNKLVGAQNFHEVFHTNSAGISGNLDLAETTSHIGGYYTESQTSPTALSSAEARDIAAPSPSQRRGWGEVSPHTVITLQFFGDIMLDRNVAKNMGAKGLDYIFEKLKGQENRFFDGVDMFVANLEGPFAPKRIKTSKSIAFRFDPALAPQLKKYNFTAFNLANNHSYDMGAANVTFTRQTLAKNGFGFFGDELNEGPMYTWVASQTSPNLSFVKERDTTPPSSAEERVGGEVPPQSPNSIAFLGIHNTYHEPDLKKVEQALVDAKQKARYVIVNVHWGEEYKRLSNKKQQNFAHWLVDHGATAVIGHHPHVVEEMEIYKNAPIFYSLGNFIFDQYFSQDTQEGLSVGLILENGGVESIHLLPFFGVKSQVKLMTGSQREAFLKWMEEKSRLGDVKIENGILNLE